MKLMNMAELHCSNYELAAETKLKTTTKFPLTSLPLFTLAAVQNSLCFGILYVKLFYLH
jgi:hypothetical protein